MLIHRSWNSVDKTASLLKLIQNGPSVFPPQLRSCSSHSHDGDPAEPLKPRGDHHSLGARLNLFSSSTYSAGSPLLHPNGSHLFLKLQSLLRAQHAYFGFREVVSPVIYKKSLWERSGHWQNYGNDMFEVVGRGAYKEDKLVEEQKREVNEDEAWGLKPMNCPGHCLIYKTQSWSYRDLPVRYADLSPLHRNEASGSLSGLTRVRRFHQDDGHIFCRPDQVHEEISKTLQMIDLVYNAFGLKPHKLRLSTRPSSGFIGSIYEWDQAEHQLQKALDESSTPWTLNPGDGAFYGPKIDVILRDSQGKEHQTATIQLDFQLPRRFELQYQSPPSSSPSFSSEPPFPALCQTPPPPSPPLTLLTPILIHRAVLGSLERFLALLIEHYAGHFPLWLSARQVKILTLNDTPAVVAHAKSIASLLSPTFSPSHQDSNGQRRFRPAQLQPLTSPHTDFVVDVNAEPIPLGRKVAQTRSAQWCVVCTVGNKEVESGSVVVDFLGLGREKGRKEEIMGRVEEIVREEGGEVGGKGLGSVKMGMDKLKPILGRVVGEWM
ncbi:hypothetical protein MMC10_003424 [Thelotrema lepadinum]|nr:hypothetical protein [Thelotrema lepadinum]